MTAAAIVFEISSFCMAPLMLGVINKTKAFFAGRTGAPSLQPYYDIWKLLQKGTVYSSATTWVFRSGPIVGFAAVATAFLLAPVGNAPAIISFNGDLVLFAGLLGLMRLFTVLAALDTGSSFEGMGASRESHFSARSEVALFLSLTVLALVSNSMSLTGMLGADVAQFWLTAKGSALALASTALFLVLLAENARIPLDDPDTHLELTMIHEVMVLDHSGHDFAFITYGSALKLWLFATLLVGILLPFHTGIWLADGAVFLAGVFGVAVTVGLVESSMARLRLTAVPELLSVAGVLGGLGVTMALVVK